MKFELNPLKNIRHLKFVKYLKLNTFIYKVTLFLALAIALAYGCTQQKKPEQQFNIHHYTINTESSIESTYFYNDHYYCVTENKKIVCLNQHFEVDSLHTDSISPIKFWYLFITQDTLFANQYLNDSIQKYYYLNKDYKWTTIERQRSNLPLFEDEKYIVTSFCLGEFGGNILFKNKATNKLYGFPVSCAMIVNKIADAHFVTTSLAHSEGNTKVIKIEDPQKLHELNQENLENINFKPTFQSPEDESKYTEDVYKGMEIIIDTFGILTMTTFVYNDHLYHINSDRYKTFISKIEGNKFTLVDSIYDKRIWKFNPQGRNNGKLQLSDFNGNETSGFVTISNDTISIVTFLNKNFAQ